MKGFCVVLPNALTGERAVMIRTSDASVTAVAVAGVITDVDVAYVAMCDLEGGMASHTVIKRSLVAPRQQTLILSRCRLAGNVIVVNCG
jgi:hypothetical protein